MNDVCTQVMSDARPVQKDLLDKIFDTLRPDHSAQDLELCQERMKTPFSELQAYESGLKRAQGKSGNSVEMSFTDHGHTLHNCNAGGNDRLLFRSSSESTFDSSAKSAYIYSADGRLTQVIEHYSSPKFEVIRKSTETPLGWKEEQWNRYGTKFNKQPTKTGRTEFKGQSDGSVVRVSHITEPFFGNLGSKEAEIHTIYDAKGRVMTLKRID